MINSKERPAQSQKEHTSLLQFHGSNVAFEEIDGKMMVNATQMAKPFGKRTRDWLITQQSQDLLKAMTEAGNLASADLQFIKKGGKNQGTWFHEEIALLFAQWLSPEFYIACNRKLKELLTPRLLITAAPVKYEIEGLIHDGKAVFPFSDACKKLGKIKYPKASKRKARHPEQFVKLYGRNFITEQYLHLLKGYYDYKNASNQLNLSL